MTFKACHGSAPLNPTDLIRGTASSPLIALRAPLQLCPRKASTLLQESVTVSNSCSTGLRWWDAFLIPPPPQTPTDLDSLAEIQRTELQELPMHGCESVWLTEKFHFQHIVFNISCVDEDD